MFIIIVEMLQTKSELPELASVSLVLIIWWDTRVLVWKQLQELLHIRYVCLQ